MLWGAIGSFAFAAVMAMLVALGFLHARRTPETQPMFAAGALPSAA